MPVLLAGLLDLSGERSTSELREKVGNALEAQNFGQLACDRRIHSEGPIALGRLSIFPRDHGRIELSSIAQFEEQVLAGDFRIYAPQEILDRTLTRGADFSCEEQVSAETEGYFLRSGRALDAKYLSDINGDFVFANWNKSTRTLSLVRDAVGIRPLMYTFQAGDYFAFASFSAGLLAMDLFALKLSEDYAARALVGNYAGESIIAGIRSIQAGAVTRVSTTGEWIAEKYWSIGEIGPTFGRMSFDDAAEELKSRIDAATRKRLSRFVRTASHLSSGLDSTFVAVCAKRALEQEGKRLVGLALSDSFSYPGMERHDEMRLVRGLIQQEGGIDLRIGDVGELLPKVPVKTFAGSIVANTVDFGEGALAAAAQGASADIVLSGHGGDEIVSGSGYTTYIELLLRGRWRRLYWALTGISLSRGQPRWRLLSNALALHFCPQTVANALGKKILNNAGLRSESKIFLEPALFARSKAFGRKDHHVSERNRRSENWSLNQIPYQTANMAHHGAALGVRYAYPLLDIGIIEFAHRLPADFYVASGHKRALMRAAAYNVLPDDIRLSAQKAAPAVGFMTKCALNKAALLNEVDALIRDTDYVQNGKKLQPILETLLLIPDDVQKAVAMDNQGIVDRRVMTAVAHLERLRNELSMMATE